MAATADGDGVPTCCRAVGLAAAVESAVTVYLPVATAAQMVANLATTRLIAVVSSFPVDHITIQLKGRSRAVRVAGEDERVRVTGWLDKFAGVVGALGLPRAVTLGLAHWPAFAVEIEVDAVFDQTPGPRAGTMVGKR